MMVMPFIGFVLGPITGIHTCIDIVVGVMWAVRVSVILAELSVMTLRKENGATSTGHAKGRIAGEHTKTQW
jgi:hypothetical protein